MLQLLQSLLEHTGALPKNSRIFMSVCNLTLQFFSGQKLSRAAYAKLYTAGFPQIMNARGEAPEVVDPADTLNFIPVKEEADRLQANEIYFQFLAFARSVKIHVLKRDCV